MVPEAIATGAVGIIVVVVVEVVVVVVIFNTKQPILIRNDGLLEMELTDLLIVDSCRSIFFGNIENWCKYAGRSTSILKKSLRTS